MKIAVALHACMDLGGIINHTEQLIGGLKDLGHSVRLMEFVYADSAFAVRKSGKFEHNGPSGIPFDQGKGWNFGRSERVAYKSFAGLNTAKQILNEFDMVIWTVPVPSKNKQNLGNDKWPDLYDLNPNVKQVAFIHDGNCKNGAPHILHIQDRLSGLACVHSCAMNGADHLTVPRALILNPQFKPVREKISWFDKKPGFVNMQTFKAWKHVHELIEAIAYMPRKKKDELREVAGMGIEYQYMTSTEKCKPEYFHDQNDEWFSSEKFWDAALMNGMTHHGYWSSMEVSDWLSKARVLVDPSWSNRYSKVGGHWNRVVVDAMIHGCIPVARKAGMGDEIFEAGIHYIDIPSDCSPEEYAETVLRTSHIPVGTANLMRDAHNELLHYFDRKVVAQALIDLVHGNIYTKTGQDDPRIRGKYEDLMFNHFGVLA